MDKVRRAYDEKMNWLNENIQKCDKRPLTQAPVVFAAQIRTEREVCCFGLVFCKFISIFSYLKIKSIRL